MRKIINGLKAAAGATVPLWLATVVILAVGATSAALISNTENRTAEPTPAATVTVEPTAPQITPGYVEPNADDIDLSIKTLEKTCFDGSGCHITFRVEYSYGGPGELDPAKTYEIRYRIKGGDTPHIGTLTVTGTAYEGAEQEFTTTGRAGDKLTAVVIDVARK